LSFTHYLFSSIRLSKPKQLLCLYKLFKFKTEVTPEDEEGNEEKIMSDFIEKLNSYSLFTLQSRIIINYFFLHMLLNQAKSRLFDQALIDIPAPAEESAEILPSQGVYELRRGRI
jgi:hypothetical protein